MPRTKTLFAEVENDTELMDNFALNVRATTYTTFIDTLRIAFRQTGKKYATHWCIHPSFGFVLFNDPNATTLFQNSRYQFHSIDVVPFSHYHSGEAAACVVWDWLKTNPKGFKLAEMDAEYKDGDVH